MSAFMNYNVTEKTTIGKGKEYATEWWERALAGEMVMVFDHTQDGSPNPGILTVVVNPIK
jgi:hypothetical protein